MTWAEWGERANRDASARWNEVSKIKRPSKVGDTPKEWLKALKIYLQELTDLEILGPQEVQRVTTAVLDKLPPADKRRILEAGLQTSVSHIIISQDPACPGQALRDRSLRINDSTKLREGKLSFLCHIDKASGLSVGGYVQLRGLDPARNDRAVYVRYDLDFAQLGRSPVTHFNAHWHVGEEPDGPDAEQHDPRLPSLPMDPFAVLDILIATYFPNGPKDLV